jgi:hypothetical protein
MFRGMLSIQKVFLPEKKLFLILCYNSDLYYYYYYYYILIITNLI